MKGKDRSRSFRPAVQVVAVAVAVVVVAVQNEGGAETAPDATDGALGAPSSARCAPLSDDAQAGKRGRVMSTCPWCLRYVLDGVVDESIASPWVGYGDPNGTGRVRPFDVEE